MVGVFAPVNPPCTIKSRSSLLAPADPGGPGKTTVKWLWCAVVLVLTYSDLFYVMPYRS